MLLIEKGTSIAGRYELVRPLARGAMGDVWVAMHRKLDSPVAIKFMHASSAASPEARGRFEREAKAAAMIRSAHIVPVVDYGVEDDTPYLVMELLHGEDLKTRIERVGRMPVGEVVEVVAQVARALRRAHEAGVIHRDLKPANVFISQNDDTDLYRVVDFGVAKTVGIGAIAGTTATGQVIGSPAYMSPEQARSEKAVDARADLWSLAVIAYRCLVGRLPFTGNGAAMMLLSIVQEAAPPPSSLAPDLPAALDAFFERGLAKSPEARFASARELATAFAEAAGSRPRVLAGVVSVDEAPFAHTATTKKAKTRTLPMTAEAHAAVPSPFAGDFGNEETRSVSDMPTVPKRPLPSSEPRLDDTNPVSDSLPTVPKPASLAAEDTPPESDSPPTLRKRSPVLVTLHGTPETPDTDLHDAAPDSDSLPTVPQPSPVSVADPVFVSASRASEPGASGRISSLRVAPPVAASQAPERPSRRRLTGGLLLAAAIAAVTAVLILSKGPGRAASTVVPATSVTSSNTGAEAAPSATAAASIAAVAVAASVPAPVPEPVPARAQAVEDPPRAAPPIAPFAPRPSRAGPLPTAQASAAPAPSSNPHRLFNADN